MQDETPLGVFIFPNFGLLRQPFGFNLTRCALVLQFCCRNFRIDASLAREAASR